MSRLTRKWSLITESNPKSPISESYRMLRTGVEYAGVDDPVDLLMVTSCRAGEGKSTTSANMAVTFAQTGQRVLLIDADMRKPSQHHIFGVSNRGGLTDVLQGRSTLEGGVQTSPVEASACADRRTDASNPSEMLASRSMASLLEQAKEEYDRVIIDTPPITCGDGCPYRCGEMRRCRARHRLWQGQGRHRSQSEGNAAERGIATARRRPEQCRSRCSGGGSYYYYYGASEEQG